MRIEEFERLERIISNRFEDLEEYVKDLCAGYSHIDEMIVENNWREFDYLINKIKEELVDDE